MRSHRSKCIQTLVILAAVLSGWPSVAWAKEGEYHGKTAATWAQQLRAPEAKSREEAEDALVRLGSEAASALPILAEELSDRDSDLRMRAVRAIGGIGPSARAAVPALIAELGKEVTDPRAASIHSDTARALGGIGSDARAAVPDLLKILKTVPEPEPWIWDVVAEALSGIGEGAKEAVPAITSLLKSPIDQRRRTTAEVLEKMGPVAKSSAAALEEATHDADMEVRLAAAIALCAVTQDGTKGIPVILGVVDLPEKGLPAWSGYPDIRKHALWSFLGMGPVGTPAVPALMKLLKDQADEHRFLAADALGAVGPGAVAAVPALIEALHDKDPGVRGQASIALGKIGPGAVAAMPTLTSLLKATALDVRIHAARAIHGITGAALEQLPMLVEALKGERSTIGMAIDALGSFGSSAASAIPELEAFLVREEDPWVRERARTALKQIRS